MYIINLLLIIYSLLAILSSLLRIHSLQVLMISDIVEKSLTDISATNESARRTRRAGGREERSNFRRVSDKLFLL